MRPSDMLAELQGRLPIRVTLKPLTQDDLQDILTKTNNNLIQQNQGKEEKEEKEVKNSHRKRRDRERERNEKGTGQRDMIVYTGHT